MESSKIRYVLLCHRPGTDPSGTLHWDLMFERAEDLLTWSLSQPPRTGQAIAARQLPVHRKEYLQYEGEISGGRGQVDRIDAGHYRLIEASDTFFEARLHEGRFAGTAVLQRADTTETTWQFYWIPCAAALKANRS